MNEASLLRQIRDRFQISQEELAHILGVSYTSINAWERGKRKPQERIVSALEKMAGMEVLPEVMIEPATSIGLKRTGAGFVSSVIDYKNKKDDLPFTHNIGRWYGSLPSFFVRDILEFIRTDYGCRGPVLANFSGSGTIALEAGLAAMDCFAIDVNPMAIALSRIKTRKCVILKDDIELAFGVVSSNKDLDSGNYASINENLITGDNKWLSDQCRMEIRRICSGINKIEDDNLRLLFAIALASISVNYANIDKRCTNHYVFKTAAPFNKDLFYNALLLEAHNYRYALSKLSQVSGYIEPVIQYGNACELSYLDNTMNAVIAHPPYGTTINYFSISRLQMSVLELIRFWSDEFQSSISNCKMNDISSSTLSRFYSFTHEWVSEASRVLAPGGVFVAIIGDSRNNGKLSHPFTEIINVGESCNLITKELFIWITNNKSGMHVKRKGNHIDHNYVIVMEKKK